ncbi:YidB family protein [Ensifer sp. 4252]|uniref:YidB family protein n=1 Tax=Ensifer sp. 4252 TaxID=3373915 RepID=UPI003D23195A
MASTALKALLGVLAVAGYQNREKIGELLRGLTQKPQGEGSIGQQEATGGVGDLLGGLTGGSGGLGGLGGLLGGSTTGGVLTGGLGDLLKQFQQNGQGEAAKSWVQTGPNIELDDRELSEALGPEVLEDLSARTGLSPDEILSRLSRDLPKAVDDLTPNGVLPQEDEISFEGRQTIPPPKTQII